MARLPDPPVLPVDPFADRLIVIYQEAERALDALIAAAANRGAKGTDRYFTNQQARVSSILRQLRRRAAPLRPALARSAYRTGVSAIDRVLDRSEAFSGVHTAAEEVVAANLEGRLRYAEERIGRAAEDALRRIALEEVGIGIAAGLSPRQQTRRLEGRLRNLDHAQIRKDGGTAFVDRRGRRWRLGVYAAMVCRTTTREAVSVGMKNRLIEHGRDLVMISEHRRSCPICLPFQGRTFSLTGQSSPEYPELEELPPFHPNCRHVLLPARVSFEQMEEALGLGPGRTDPEPAEPEEEPALESTVAASDRYPVTVQLRQFEDLAEKAREQITSIEEVHRIPRDFPEVGVRVEEQSTEWRQGGHHEFSATVDSLGNVEVRRQEIVVNAAAMGHDPAVDSTVHEIGHSLDARGLGLGLPDLRTLQRTEFHSAGSPEWEEWREAIRGSTAYQQIRGDTYAGDWKELWARSYEQWIATRSGNERLLAKIRWLRDDLGGVIVPPGLYWKEDEFGPIAAAFDRLFRSRGLLRE